jgi:hypothetical protein
MSEKDNNSGGGRNATALYGTTCRAIYNDNLTKLAQDFPITEILPELGLEFAYQPALSYHREPYEPFRLDRLQGLVHLMVAHLFHAGKLPVFEQVLGLHDRKGCLIVVIDTKTTPADVRVLVRAACQGWGALNEVEACIALRDAGKRPHKPIVEPPPPLTPTLTGDGDGGGFVDRPLFWITVPKTKEPA